ncbi:phage major capsid protein [Arthrobacter sp. SDTb3-6]|uniref:phage major capsid protein n=1 Tax=Arthrobacter sp. SDTb3-6 TaxID=2713571 RepID=UPI00159DA360|nr:phage major capsid protein [Arthrobacter sp. SDTb3-6]NVM97822.1 phage major capsid protein [Arthrobacter sp. SDTb3-6]
MDPKVKLAALNNEAAALRKKALENAAEFTEADATRAAEIAKEHGELTALIERQKAAAASLNFAGAGTSSQENTDTPDQSAVGKSIGAQFVKSEAYRGFRKKHPSGVGKDTPISIKAEHLRGSVIAKVDPAPLGTAGAGNARAVRTNEVDDLVYRPARRLLDLITRGNTNLPWFQYRQVISKTNNASIVAEAATTAGTTPATGLKPLSTLTTTTADAKAFTYADGMEVTNQELSDDGVIQSLIDSTLTENLEIEIENILLNGAGTADEPAGIFNTSGVLQQAWATDVPTTVRKAITKLRNASGANIRGVLLNPEDDETWDLLKDSQGRYLGAGPFASGPSTAWGYERINSQAVPVGQAIAGDFATIHLLQLEALSIMAFNQHKDYAQRNLTYIRAEERAVQLIRNAARLIVIDLTAA